MALTLPSPSFSPSQWDSSSSHGLSAPKRKREGFDTGRETLMSREYPRSREMLDSCATDRDNETGTKRWWRCPECRVSNDLDQEFCEECGLKGIHYVGERPNRSNVPTYQRRRSFSEASVSSIATSCRDDNRSFSFRPDASIFSRKNEPRREARPRKPPLKRTWPPGFEFSGSSYIFDQRSGFFYESSSEFFYDPKTKLYYGNKQKSYFRFCPGETPPYRRISQQPEPTNEQNLASSDTKTTNSLMLPPEQRATQPTNDAQNKSDVCPTNGTTQDKIAISLKKKKRSKSEPPKASQIRKRHADDIMKWSQRRNEMRQDSITSTPKPKPSVTTAPSSAQQPPEKRGTATNTAVTGMTGGQPSCLLCKRKFADMEKLKLHVQLSTLHKQNLAKKAAADASKKNPNQPGTPNSSDYRDRAKERRVMYGPSPVATISKSENKPIQMVSSLTKARTVTVTETVRPDEILSESNIGNQMLQKLGWKKGEPTTDVEDKLKEDWETIEALAGRNRKQTRGS